MCSWASRSRETMNMTEQETRGTKQGRHKTGQRRANYPHHSPYRICRILNRGQRPASRINSSSSSSTSARGLMQERKNELFPIEHTSFHGQDRLFFGFSLLPLHQRRFAHATRNGHPAEGSPWDCLGAECNGPPAPGRPGSADQGCSHSSMAGLILG